MFSKTTQPTLINSAHVLSNNSPYNVKSAQCQDSENSLSFERYGLFY